MNEMRPKRNNMDLLIDFVSETSGVPEPVVRASFILNFAPSRTKEPNMFKELTDEEYEQNKRQMLSEAPAFIAYILSGAWALPDNK